MYDWYAQDDWRVLPGLTLNFGLRYEYFSPYVEKNNRLVNLDHNADFTVVAPVLPDADRALRRELSTIAGQSGSDTVLAAAWVCVAARSL